MRLAVLSLLGLLQLQLWAAGSRAQDRGGRCGFVSVDGRAASLTRSIVGLLPQMAEFGCAIMIACGFEVCAANPRIRCLRAQRQSSDPRFAQQNPRMVRIRTLCLTSLYIIICGF